MRLGSGLTDTQTQLAVRDELDSETQAVAEQRSMPIKLAGW